MKNKDTGLLDFLLSFNETTLSPENLKLFNEQLAHVFFATGSETEDNVACMEHIEYNHIKNVVNDYYGLKIIEKNISIIDVLACLEDNPMPMFIKKRFTNLTQTEWESVFRMAIMIFISLEYRLPREDN